MFWIWNIRELLLKILVSCGMALKTWGSGDNIRKSEALAPDGIPAIRAEQAKLPAPIFFCFVEFNRRGSRFCLVDFNRRGRSQLAWNLASFLGHFPSKPQVLLSRQVNQIQIKTQVKLHFAEQNESCCNHFGAGWMRPRPCPMSASAVCPETSLHWRRRCMRRQWRRSGR